MPANLDTYLQDVQRFLKDQKQDLVDPADLISYVNKARRHVAMKSACLRALPNISGSVVQARITSGGSGYTAPVATITPPDFPSGLPPFPNGAQATAVAEEIGGVVVGITITYGGSGYLQPQITITDPHGDGATAILSTNVNNLMTGGQEQYLFSGVDLSMFPGYGAIHYVRSVSVIYSNYRYSVPIVAFSTYQSMIRQYVAGQYQYVPAYASQFGQGTSGSLFLYPPPSQIYQMEWDCQCLPQDLVTGLSVEAIADPWTDAVSYYAAYLAYLELQNANSARMYLELYEKHMADFSRFTRPGRLINPYGRGIG